MTLMSLIKNILFCMHLIKFIQNLKIIFGQKKTILLKNYLKDKLIK